MILSVIKIYEIHAQASEVVILEVFSNHGDSMSLPFSNIIAVFACGIFKMPW